MNISYYIRKANAKLSALLLCGLVLCSCDSIIYDYEGDCSVNYKVRFCYDYNMKFADAFAHEVSSVTLYLVDAEGKVVWQGSESGEALAAKDYAMTVDINPGTYDLLAWCGTTDKKSFDFGSSTLATGLDCTLKREHDKDGNAFIDKDIDRLFHGYLPAQEFPEWEGTYYYTVPLVKNTNNIRIVLQQLSGEAMDPERFSFTLTDDNGKMSWDNSLIADETISYHEWYKASGYADMNTGGNTTQMLSAVVAELTVARLMKDHKTRLTITDKEEGEVIFSIPFIDYALLVKGFYNRNMEDQEYLDRQDEYDMIFFLDDTMRWIDSYIYINSWKVVPFEAGLGQ